MTPNPQTSRQAGRHSGAWVGGLVIFVIAFYLACPWVVAYAAAQAGRHGLISEQATHGVIRVLCKVPCFFALHCEPYKKLMGGEMEWAPEYVQMGSEPYGIDTLDLWMAVVGGPPYPVPFTGSFGPK